MSDLRAYKCIITLRSSLDTPLQADIIWGCMVWALKYLYGREKVEELISSYSSNPPLIVSDGFPCGYLPRPMCDVNQEKLELIIKASVNENLTFKRAISVLKTIVFPNLLPGDVVKSILSEPDKLLSIAADVLKCHVCPSLLLPVKKIKKIKGEIRTLINNVCKSDTCFYLTGQSGAECERIVSNFSKSVPSCFRGEKGEKWDIYLLSTWDKNNLLELLTFTGTNGYGRNASCGKGTFFIENFLELSSQERLDRFKGDEDGFMTLASSYIPLAGEIENTELSRFKVLIKIGKLGGHWASMKNFHKYPQAMCRAGSIFPASPSVKKFWGQLGRKVHPELEEIVQYGWAFPVWGNFFEKR